MKKTTKWLLILGAISMISGVMVFIERKKITALRSENQRLKGLVDGRDQVINKLMRQLQRDVRIMSSMRGLEENE